MTGILQALLMRFFYMFLKVSGFHSFPVPLEPEEEAICFSKMKKGDKKAREILIEHNLRLVAHIVKKYYNSGCSQEDLMSIGTIGLIKAVDSFNPDIGIRFATYASKCLQNEILMYMRSTKKLNGEVSVNETIDTDKDGNPLTYIDVIACEDTIADDIDLKIRSARAKRLIQSSLTLRERQIIVLRYGLGKEPPKPQREIAKLLGISRSYVSRIEKSALEKLKHGLSRPGF